MKAVVITKPGGPEVLALEERPDPVPAAGEVRVRVRASSLNRADLIQRRGLYPPPPGYPADIPGLEFAGEVESLGEGVARWRIGDRVMGLIGGGGHAELVCARENELLAVPDRLDWPAAGSTSEVFMTAFDALFRLAKAEAGDRVLIHAVGSGVGTAAVQLCRAMGLATAGTSRSARKLEAARELGLELPIDSGAGWVEATSEWAGDDGVDVVLDLVGGSYVAGDIKVLAERGRIVLVGLVGGSRADVPLGLLLRKRGSLIGTVLRSRPVEERVALVRDFAERALPLIANGSIAPIIDRVYDFSEVVDAHRYLESNESFGKVALRW